MRVIPAILATGLIWASGTLAAAAGPFDGKWIAEMAPQSGGRCNYTSTLEAVVADGNIQGQVHNPGNVRVLQGHVDAGGDATFTVGTSPGTGKFTSDHFDLTWFNGNCNRHAMGDRAPSDDQQKQIAERRKAISGKLRRTGRPRGQGRQDGRLYRAARRLSLYRAMGPLWQQDIRADAGSGRRQKGGRLRRRPGKAGRGAEAQLPDRRGACGRAPIA